MTSDQKENLGRVSSIISICAGVAAVFLWEFSIISIIAIIFGIIGTITDKNKWRPVIGLGLGLIYLVARTIASQ
jgi:hypothetical protein